MARECSYADQHRGIGMFARRIACPCGVSQRISSRTDHADALRSRTQRSRSNRTERRACHRGGRSACQPLHHERCHRTLVDVPGIISGDQASVCSQRYNFCLQFTASLAVVLSAAFVASAFFGINYTLAIWAAMLYLSATGGSRDEQYVSLALNAPCLKDWSAPVSLLNVAIDTEYTLKKLLRLIRGDRILTVEIRDGSRRVARLTEEEVCDLCMRFPLSTTVGQAISSFRPTADV